MLIIRDLINPNKKNEVSDYTISANDSFGEISIKDISEVNATYIGVRDENEIIGAIKKEKLLFLLKKRDSSCYAKLLECLDVGIIMIDMDSRIFYINPAYSRILGIETARVIGQHLNQIEPKAALLNVLKTGTPQRIENQLVQTVGKYVSTEMHPIIENGSIVGAFSVFTDTTQINKLYDEVERITEVAEEYSRQVEEQSNLKNAKIIGKSKPFVDCINKVMKVAPTDALTLIRGESGCGKEVITKLIRANSNRSDKPFITVNCSAIPESLIESELFGYEDGTFTGAHKGGKMGKFQLADGGTIFLDEIGDLPYAMQAKLLRVLQEGEIEKIGRKENLPIDVRVIAATNKPLEEMVKNNQFRQDLYYRLNVISITIPPLRERSNDCILLANAFLHEYNEKYGRNISIHSDVYQSLRKYSWPGNVRQLKNVIESAVILCEGQQIRVTDLPEEIVGKKLKESAEVSAVTITERIDEFETLKDAVEAYESKIIRTILEENKGDIDATIKRLNISRRTLFRKSAKNGTGKAMCQ